MLCEAPRLRYHLQGKVLGRRRSIALPGKQQTPLPLPIQLPWLRGSWPDTAVRGSPWPPRGSSRAGKAAPGRGDRTAALEMRSQPRGRQGHLPTMSWLNKAVYQHRVDTAELGTESQRALAMGPGSTRRAWGIWGAGGKCPLLQPFSKKATAPCAHCRDTQWVALQRGVSAGHAPSTAEPS